MSAIATTPLLWLTVTLIVFAGADHVSMRSNRHPLCHPVLLATPVLIAALVASGTPYPVYRDATASLAFLLGPAVVGLAVPVWARRALIRRLAAPIALALAAGATTAIASAVGILWLFGAPPVLLASIAPRATTTPVAMALAQTLHGIPPLAAVLVLTAGVIGAMTATPLFDRMGIRDYRARGFAIGVSAHGFGAARAFQVSEAGGAFASLAMALNAIATAALLSLLAVCV